MTLCPVCNSKAKICSLQSDIEKVVCKRCGTFHITYNAKLKISEITENRKRANLSSWLSDKSNYKLSSNDISRLLDLKTLPFQERADNLLKYIASKTNDSLSRNVPVDDRWISKSSSSDRRELEVFLSYLKKLERIIPDNQGLSVDGFAILPNGWLRLEDISKVAIDSQQAFVAMWFDPDMKPIYDDVISKAILDAGYCPHRVDQREHNDKIDDEIISQIRRSKFVIADFTGHRGGVYYEAGFAKGLGLEVFWLCREDELEHLHFDIRQYNCITWSLEKKKELKDRLKNRIESVLGHGAYKQ